MIPQELRIGNYVYLQGLPAIVNLTTLERVLYPEMTKYRMFQGQYTGIPLNKEILLKCGFKVQFDENKKPRYSHKKLPMMELLYGDIGIINYMLFFHRWNLTRGDGLKYLHQLQNLFFALSDEELEVKL